MPRLPRTRASSLRLLLVLALVGAGLPVLLPPAAVAVGTPDIDATVVVPDEVPYGEATPVTVSITNPTAVTGHNLAARVVLPRGVRLVPGSLDVATPTVVTDAPSLGQTTLLLRDLGVVGPGSTQSFDLEVVHDVEPAGTALRPGSMVQVEVSAHVNDDPDVRPTFDAGGLPTGGFTGTDTASRQAPIVPFTVDVVDTGAAGPVLRGLHDHQVERSVVVRNNTQHATADLRVDAWLHAGWEFLACGDVDATLDAATNRGSTEEFPGAGSVAGRAAAPLGCRVPDLVETVFVDPDAGGPLPKNVYTHVRWADVGDAGPGATVAVPFLAAVGLRGNSLSWSGAQPPTTSASGTPPQAANLDNNAGTRVLHGTMLATHVEVNATYTGAFDAGTNPTRQTARAEREVADVRVTHDVDAAVDGVAAGDVVAATATVETGEYRWVRDAPTLAVDLHDGLCPVGSGGDARCVPGAPPTLRLDDGENLPVAWSSQVERPDGGFDLAVVLPRPLAPSSRAVLTHRIAARDAYQQDGAAAGPVHAGDVLPVAATASGGTWLRCHDASAPPCAPGARADSGEPAALPAGPGDGAPVEATRVATVTARLPTLALAIGENAAGGPGTHDCATATWTTLAVDHRPGDRLCLRVTLADAGATAGAAQVVLVLPEGVSVEAGSPTLAPTNAVTPAATTVTANRVAWDLDDVAAGATFDAFVALLVDPDPLGASRVRSHVATLATSGTDVVGVRRAEVTDRHVEPDLAVDLSIGGLDATTAHQGDVVAHTIAVTNVGGADAVAAQLRMVLPPTLACEDLLDLPPGATCAGRTLHLDGTNGSAPVGDVAAGSSLEIPVDLRVPDGGGASAAPSAGHEYVLTAGVRQYEVVTNRGGARTVFVPAANVDPDQDPMANTDSADDDAQTHLPLAELAVATTTSLDEAGNAADGQAANGEAVLHALELTVVRGTTVRDARLELPLPPELLVAPGSTTIEGPGIAGAAAADCAATLPNGFRLCDDGGVVVLELGAEHQNATAVDQAWTVTVASVVAQDAARGTIATSPTTLTWAPDHVVTASSQVAVVAPRPGVTKTSDAVGEVGPGQEVGYVVRVDNGTGGDVATWHDLVVVDTLPSQLIPLDAPGGSPAADGGDVAGTGPTGTWDLATRTVTWSLPSLAPGAAIDLDYAVQVTTDPVAAASYVNEVTATGDSFPGAAAEQLTVAVTTDAALATATPGLVVALDDPVATIGEERVATATLTVPPDVRMPDTTVDLDLPDGLALVGFEPPPPGATTATTGPRADGTTTATWHLGDLAIAAVEREVAMSLRVRVADDLVVGQVQRGMQLRSTGRLAWRDAVGDPVVAVPAITDLLVAEPSLYLDLDIAGQSADSDVRRVDVDDLVTMTLSLTNANQPDVVAAWDAQVAVDVPVELDLDPATVTDGGTWDPATRRITWELPGPIAPGASATMGFAGTPADSATLGGIESTIGVRTTGTVARSFGRDQVDPAAPAATDRTYSGPTDEVTVQVDFPAPRLVVVAEASEVRTNEPFEWWVEAHNDATVATADGLRMTATLPPNWTLEPGTAEVEHPTSGGFVPVTPVVSGRDVVVDLAGLTDLPPSSRVVLRFDALGGPGTATDPGVGVPSVLEVVLDAVDGDGNPANGDAAYRRTDDASTIVREVSDIAVDVTVDRATVDQSDPRVLVQATAENLGPNDASGLVVRVAVPLTQVDVAAVVATHGAWDPVTGEWDVGALPAGTVARLDVELDAQRPEPTDPDPVVVLGEVERLDQFDEGFGPSSAQASFHVVRADLRLALAASDGPWFQGDDVTLTWTLVNDGPDDARGARVATSVPAGLVVTGAVHDGTWDGDTWVPPDLAPGARATLVLTADLAAVGVHDVVGELVAADQADPDSVPGNDARDEDDRALVVVTVTGASLGDLVWFDADADGVQDGSEPAMPGVLVELRDATGTMVDLVATDPSGSWSFDDLPGGTWTVHVRETSLPPGVVVLGGPSIAVTLANGEVRDDVDVGVAGRAWVGDDAWYDLDTNGLRDPGESSIVGLQVVVTWFGGDGTPGTGDDVRYPAAATAASGTWAVGRLPHGTFLAEVVDGLPAGMVPSHDLDGIVTPGSATFVIGDDVGRTDVDWGFTGSGTMGDAVWFDVDGDAEAGPGEPGVPGVEVSLRWRGQDGVAGTGDDVVHPVVTTGSDGGWSRTGLAAGIYDVAVTGGLPAGLVATRDADTIPDGTTQVTLPAGAVRDDVDFGFTGTGLLGDVLYLDLDDDEVEDAGEPGVMGLQLTATWYGFDDVPRTADDVVHDLVTTTGGGWRVPRAAPGTYEVALRAADLPAGTRFAGDPDGGRDGRFVHVLAADANDLDADLGITGTGRAGGTVWLDSALDGVHDGDEQGVAGTRVLLEWTGPDGSFGTSDDVSLPAVASDAAGAWTHPNLPGGGFDIALDVASLPGGTSPAVDPDGGSDGRHTLFLGAGGVDDALHFGVHGIDVVGDLVFLDLDGDGRAEPGEPGLPDVGLTLTWAGLDGDFGTGDEVVRTTTTAADGSYLFRDLPDGPTRVVVDRSDLPEGVEATTDGDDTPDGIAEFVLTGGSTSIDLGFGGTAEVGDQVWFDLSRDGVDDVAEPGLGGIAIDVTWSGLDGRHGTADDVTWPRATSGPDGRWRVPHLVRGTYTVEVVAGVAATLVPTYDEDDGATDPDGRVEGVFVGAGSRRDDLDFAFVGPWTVGDLVWLDLDGDGTPEDGEPGLGAVDVVVAWAGNDGVSGTIDDVLVRTTSAADGTWSIDGMPDGALAVAADPDTVLAGLVPTGAVPLGGVLAGAGDDGLDLGFRGSSSVGDLVWFDIDGDGVRQATEPGVAGAQLRVTWAGVDAVMGTSDDLVAGSRTDADGAWRAGGLPDGEVRVVLRDDSLPPGMYAVESARSVVVAAGEARDDLDFAVRGVGSLGGHAFLDRDRDGLRGPAEPRLDGVEFRLVHAGEDGAFGTADDAVAPPVVTGHDGAWLLENAPAGRWRLQVQGAPAGLVLHADPDSPVGGADGTATLPLRAGQHLRDLDVGWAADGVMSGTVVFDPSGQGVAGTGISLTWAGRDGELGTADDATMTDLSAADGTWRLDGLPAGEYGFAVDAPGGFEVVAAPAAVQVLGRDEHRSGLDVRLGGTRTAGGTVWLDVDNNDLRSDADAVLAGVVLRLAWAGPDGVPDTADDVAMPGVTTAADGRWTAEQLPSGDLVVTLDEAPAGTVPGVDADGGVDGRVVADAGPDIDIALVGTGRIGDRVFWDADGDGNDGVRLPQDVTTPTDRRPEAGVPGVPWTAVWAGVDGLLDSEDDVPFPAGTSGVDGAWWVQWLPAGPVRATFDLPDGWVAPDGVVREVDLAPDALRDDVDVALHGNSAVHGVVVDDADGDGVRDRGDGPLAGVAIAVVQGGADGLLGTADDVAATRSSAVDGRFEVVNLPPGPASVEPASMPAGRRATVALPIAVEAAPDADEVVVPLQRAADLQLVMTRWDELGVGAAAGYGLAVGNAGPAPATGVEVVVLLPAGLQHTDVTSPGWECGVQPVDERAAALAAGHLPADAEALVCRHDGVLGVGGTVSLDLAVTVGPEAFPSVTNRAVVTSELDDPDWSDNVASETGDVRPLADLQLRKTVQGDALVSGGEAVYAMEVRNRGPNVDTGPVTVVDDLPDSLELTAFGGVDWSCDDGAGGPGAVVTCAYDGVLAVGEQTVVLLTVLVHAEPGERITNLATVVGGSAVDPDPTGATSVVPETPVEGPATLANTGAPVGWAILGAVGLASAGGGVLLVGGDRRRRAGPGPPGE